MIPSMLYGWAANEEVRLGAASGGLVTGILQCLLSRGFVDAVCTLEKGEDLYDPRPVLITDPDKLLKTKGSLYCGTILTADWIMQTTASNPGIKIGAVVKGCDAKAIIELIKRHKLDRNDLFLIGLNCSGTISPIKARTFVRTVCNEDPDLVQSFSIRNGRLQVITPDKTLEYSLDSVDESGFGRRDACRRCNIPIPRQCDLVCGNWGLIGDDTDKATFVEVCSKKGAQILESARKDGFIELFPADQKGISARERVEAAMLTLSTNNREYMFSKMGTGFSRLNWMMKETSRCIKCYQCTHACPLCTCEDCQTKKPWLVKPGEIPPPFMFHLIRFSHIADSCINCGQCEDRCAMDIPISLMMHAMQVELEQMFGYHPGWPEGMPVLAKMNEREEWEHYYGNRYHEMVRLFSMNGIQDAEE
ncbi:Coenzyme F420 hydrogenase/dehydrogenase, beta subunit C-terminal domain [Methanospirillum stamsii]|uniref:Formate dehydrogenase n=1 Tax=Methanospirillum stamsii TaxID=1277351 RepID=A0A2V2MWZ7_9EURY|nr:Coenzyme F420 hydrogenase/dehydrogenase, beta subunit C-terminal domain [Methanospirillum stamsii]PWR72432.1 formate dehydrogenase [Methanospirillum stamsii]